MSQQLVNGSFETNGLEGETYTFYGSSLEYITFESLNIIDGVNPIDNEYNILFQFIDLTYAAPNGQIFLPNGVSDGEKCLFFLGSVIGSYDLNDTARTGLTLDLTFPLITGATYNLSFYKTKKDSVLQVEPINVHHNASPFRIGLSSDSNDFGQEIYYVDTVADYGVFWEYEEFEFIAPFPAEYISLESVNIDSDTNFWRSAAMVDHIQLNYVRDPLPDIHTPDSETDSHGTDGLGEELQFAELDFYPNPNNGFFELKSNRPLNSQLTVFNQLGEKVYEFTPQLQVSTVDLSHLNSGVYFISGQCIKPKRIVIQKD